jgi:diguanylate cyclase (GGDEF)-like protein
MENQIAAKRFPLYDLLSGLPGPRRIAHKILLVALLGSLAPLFSLAVYILFFTTPDSFDRVTLLVVLAGTALGALLTLFAVRALLTPIGAVGKALVAFEKARDLPRSGRRYEGEIGELLNNTELALCSLRHSIEHLEACAQVDVLTRLPNRQGADQRLQRMDLSDAENPRALLLLFIDLEGFGRINETHGRAIGDRVLQRVGQLLRSSLRERDWVARWGGDEFLLVLSNNDRQDVAGLTARLRDQLAALPVDEAGTLVLDIGFCAGAAYLEPGMSVDELVEQADQACRLARQNPAIHCFVAGEVSA